MIKYSVILILVLTNIFGKEGYFINPIISEPIQTHRFVEWEMIFTLSIPHLNIFQVYQYTTAKTW